MVWKLRSVVTVFALLSANAVQAKPPLPVSPIDLSAYRAAWSDPVIERRISDGIDRNRKNRLTIRVIDAAGRPVAGARVALRQTRQQFQFGANGFMLGGFADSAKNRLWEDRFSGLFNLVAAPFYWKDFEPQPGAYRIATNSPPIYRRPPAETVLGFAARAGIEAKGHTLVWKEPKVAIPAWWPASDAERLALMEKRIAFLADTFGERIRTWDVVNEVIRSSRMWDPKVMPDDYVFRSFEIAARHFPRTAELVLNEATSEAWDEYAGDDSPFYLVARGLIARGARVDALGLQMHYFDEKEFTDTLSARARTPADLFRVLDLYARLGRPIHISEITIPTLARFGGEATQAELARNMYRLWFSHPSVASITWWNLADGTALADEDRWMGGLVRKGDFAKKPAYLALEQLIAHDWISNLSLATAPDGTAGARVFHGTYAITVDAGRRRAVSAATLDAGQDRSITVTVR